MRPSFVNLSFCLSFCFSPTLLAQGGTVEGAPPAIQGTAPPASSVVTPAPAGAPTIVPKTFATRMSNRANSIPWSWTPTHFQSPYLGSEMPANLVINCIGFRHGNRRDTGATIDLEIWLGFTTFDRNTITGNYASNQNSGTPVLVYTRKMYKVPDMGSPNTTPTFFSNQIKLDKPFVWVQQSGRNLLFECKVHGNSAGNRSFSYFPENSTGTVASGNTTTRVYSNNNANATTGFVTRGLAPILSLDTKCKVNADYTIFGKGCKGTGGFAGQVLPGLYASRWGESNNVFGVGRSNMRYQQIMDGADFGTGAKTLTGLNYRQDDRSTGRTGGTTTVKIRVGQSDLTPGNIDFNFDKHFDSKGGKDVFSGTVNLPNQTGLNSDLSNFWQYAKFTTPFVWLPLPNKDFLVEIINTGTNVNFFQDAAFNFELARTARVYALTATATRATAGTRNFGLVMGFNVLGGVGSAVPSIASTGRPIINTTTFSVDLAQAKPSTAALLTIGASDKKFLGLTLPFDLTALGMTGCSLLASMELTQGAATDAKGNAAVKLPIPSDTTLVGKKVFNQFLIVDTKANTAGFVWTAGGALTVGEQ